MDDNGKMKPYFPAIINGCDSAANDFFKCINESLQPYGDNTAIKNGTNQCLTLKNNYEKCTESSLKKMTENTLMFLTEYKGKKI
ncbi:conserved Plasmodium protein, unknown function [Plasmodium berghei]|uniref:Uncharacterized protein n=2 Tax=Plasmodium berghei TaxID=5821 RepID=A0A509AQ50_PLABA|nr:conserved Plasmodium protein, unknown function [Plasmodium berghei ANKA]CXI96128.1 conserved Plasmodium protein, unknown function [Plasmodium berghei]SCL97271.1 conserved Plasmodium protein, unknown function [Plasmodium berghei]SCM16585.1 conserved Plasmodium protein, unknown function [Plasmodium berghei]SCM18382.1 conserved Plasmodium protein, unknown function [Plasmodium berghei]SCN27812.1 conserved Plasmodium protein, unknown function [Plasmodium berghei]|eukprot:XP_034423466.1 conserved Plasmodium protein, unknown function [Plasmodium berghei ANKA]